MNRQKIQVKNLNSTSYTDFSCMSIVLPQLFGDLDLLDKAGSDKTNSGPTLPHLNI